MSFNKGEIIKHNDELFEVETNNGTSGSVWVLTDTYERTGVLISNFHWNYASSKSKLIQPVK